MLAHRGRHRRAQYEVVGEQTAKSTKSANPPSWWCAALRAVSCPVSDASTTFAVASAIYVANHCLQSGDYVDFAELAPDDSNGSTNTTTTTSTTNNNNDNDSNKVKAATKFTSRFTARIVAIVVVRHAGAKNPVTLLDTIAMRPHGHNILADTEQHFVMCFNAAEAQAVEVKSYHHRSVAGVIR